MNAPVVTTSPNVCVAEKVLGFPERITSDCNAPFATDCRGKLRLPVAVKSTHEMSPVNVLVAAFKRGTSAERAALFIEAAGKLMAVVTLSVSAVVVPAKELDWSSLGMLDVK